LIDLKTCTDGEALIKRLKRIEGQIRGIIKMVEDDKPCEDILVQISSVKAAAHGAGRVLLEGHLNNCVFTGLESAGLEDHQSREEIVHAFTSALDRFMKIT